MTATNVKSCNLVLNWIEKVWKDLSKTIQYRGNEETVVTGQGSRSNSVGISTNDVEIVRDPVIIINKISYWSIHDTFLKKKRQRYIS